MISSYFKLKPAHDKIKVRELTFTNLTQSDNYLTTKLNVVEIEKGDGNAVR